MRTVTIEIHLLNKDKIKYNVLAIAAKGTKRKYVVTTTNYNHPSPTKASHAVKSFDSIYSEIKDLVPDSDLVRVSEEKSIYCTYYAFLRHLNTGADYGWLKQSGWRVSPLFEEDIQAITKMVHKALGGL